MSRAPQEMSNEKLLEILQQQVWDICGVDYAVDEDETAVGIWIAKSGHMLLIADMTTQHIKNAIAMLERHGSRHHPAYEHLKAELETRNG